MKLDVNVLRYLSKDEFRVLTAVEMGQKNHEIVPMPLIDSISGLKHGGAFRCIRALLKHKLVHHEGKPYDGYRLTYMGYDFLAIRSLTMRGHISGVGRQIGVGKESDIYEVMNDEGEVFALKLHRLGRTSFRAVRKQRDYLGKRTQYSWLYLSRLSALKEFAFMKALGDNGFPVPLAIDCNRHAVLMTLLNARPMVQVTKQIRDPATVFLTCMELISRLAGKGLIHCDFNEFNLMLDNDTEEVTIIDFPQMVSVSHANAQELFERDVECIVRFFSKKVGYDPENDRSLPYVRPKFEDAVAEVDESLDVALAASGFQRNHQTALEAYLEETQGDSEADSEEQEEDEGEEGEEGEEDSRIGEDSQGVDLGQDAGQESGAGAGGSRTGGFRSGEQGQGLDEHPGNHTAGGDGEGSDDEAGSEELEDEEEGTDGEAQDEDEEGARKRGGQARRVPRPAKLVTPLGAREVQAAVAAQHKKSLKNEIMHRATRNSSKQAKGKGTRKQKGAGGGTADFGGW